MRHAHGPTGGKHSECVWAVYELEKSADIKAIHQSKDFQSCMFTVYHVGISLFQFGARVDFPLSVKTANIPSHPDSIAHPGDLSFLET